MIIFVYLLKSMCIPQFTTIGCCISELYVHIYIPVVIYSLRLFIVVYKKYNVYNVVCMLVSSGSYHFSKFCCSIQFLNVLPEGVYCCFTRTTSITTMFIMIVKCMCIPSFILIGFCISELHVHYVPIVMYGLRLFIVVLQELYCLQRCNFPIPWSLWISISMQSFVSQLCLVIEIRYRTEEEQGEND